MHGRVRGDEVTQSLWRRAFARHRGVTGGGPAGTNRGPRGRSVAADGAAQARMRA
ncbi:hypothetical protein AZ78_0975 [Lysobacter capsici AZ78]|uniref:Uncharacterized protein n=1 Tax=Lysobacter capsici AZ78 TaxID=1444315 RepID=A0A125MMH4_9GAMM|nr:hypothetical protein AZ78_0975 [Lysobacter capsici AZ78]